MVRPCPARCSGHRCHLERGHHGAHEASIAIAKDEPKAFLGRWLDGDTKFRFRIIEGGHA